jgi:transcriptional regulator with XRE-family HTH domain
MRLSRQLTMAGFADLAGVPVSTISRIESGKIEPTVAMLARIAQAAGFQYESVVTEMGSDQPYADILERLGCSDVAERARLFARLPSVALTAPVASRLGLRRVAIPGNLTTAVEMLQNQGHSPIVSSIEAVVGSVDPIRSFVPLVYVNDPDQASGFEAAGGHPFQTMLLLPTTDNVRRWERNEHEVSMVCQEWGWLDAMASPGRQGDIARDDFQMKWKQHGG